MTEALQKLMKEQPAIYKALLSKMAAEASLYEFLRQAWPAMEATEFQESWHLKVVCDELQKVTEGEKRYLLINLPPRCAKTTAVSICWPLWTWIQEEKSITSGNGVRFLCASYGDRLTLENAEKMRDLLCSQWFNSTWGEEAALRSDRNMKSSYSIASGGARVSTSISGSLLGLGGDIIIVDDPHNTESVESDAERETTMRGWREISSTRLNDPKKSAIVVVMQRLHESDVSGVIIGSKDYDKWEHLMFPMRHDSARHCHLDPRIEYGELMWPDRFGEGEVAKMERELGPYMSSGRLQQSPSPAGGGVIKRDYWKLWPEEGEDPVSGNQDIKRMEYPVMDFVIASIDTAYTSKQESDFNALSVLGLWRHQGLPKIMLMHAWQKRLDFRGEVLPRLPDEAERDYRIRRQRAWGMLEWTAFECARFKVDKLIVENKATGITLAQEIRKAYAESKWDVQLVNPRGDKLARVYSVQHIFAEGMVYAPERDWAELAINEFEKFPKGAHDDLCDSITQGLIYLRNSGWALRNEEVMADKAAAGWHIGNETAALYDV